MPKSTVKQTPPGVTNPYGTYTTLYKSHRMSEMYSNPSKDYSVKGSSSKNTSKNTPSKSEKY